MRQLTPRANAIRAHLGKFGIIVAKDIHNMGRVAVKADAADLPMEAKMPLDLLASQFRDTRIDVLTARIKEDAVARRLQTRAGPENDPGDRFPGDWPGIGLVTASVLAATLPDLSAFRTARDMSVWLGLTPKPHSNRRKERLGAISKMGNRYIRRLL